MSTTKQIVFIGKRHFIVKLSDGYKVFRSDTDCVLVSHVRYEGTLGMDKALAICMVRDEELMQHE